MITDVPPVVWTPVTVVDVAGPVTTVATPGLALLHVPPPVASLKVIVEPGQTVVTGAIIGVIVQDTSSSAPISGVVVLRVCPSMSIGIASGVVIGMPAGSEPTDVKCRFVDDVHNGVGL